MAAPRPDDARALARARLLALDVDGTLTDGTVLWAGDTELQRFHVVDGQGLVWLREAGVVLAWITGRGCAATERRAQELGVQHLVAGVGAKDEVLRALQGELGIGKDETVSMGDDLPDLGLAAESAFFACPADARPEVCAAADFVAAAMGGRGAVRELCEAMLRARGAWDGIAGR